MEGVKYFFRGLAMIARPGLRQYVVIPILISLVLFGGGFMYGYQSLMAYVGDFGSSSWGWFDWLRTLILPLIKAIYISVFLMVTYFTFSILANLIGSPFNSLLATKVEEHLLGGESTSSLEDVTTPFLSYGPAIWDELKKIGYALLLLLPVLLFLIPPLTVVFPVVWVLYGAWIMVVNYSDYPMGNHGLKGAEMRRRLWQQRFTALTFGVVVATLMAVPLINIVVMPAAVAGATIFWVERLRQETDA